MAVADEGKARTGKHVRYAGRVQGVGFRYTARQLASEFPVAGWVRNLRNGEVEVFVEGKDEDVQGFLSSLESLMASYISRCEVVEEPPRSLVGFEIRY